MTELEQYLKDSGFYIYKSAEDPLYEYRDSSKFEKYLYTKEEFFMHIDEYDEDLYKEDLICIYKYYNDSEEYWYYSIYISKIIPGIGTGKLEFKQDLAHNEELCVEYIKNLRTLLNI